MKQTVAFTFDMPEEREYLEMLLSYQKNAAILADYKTWLREVFKYSDPDMVTAGECRDKLYEIIRENQPE